MNKENKSRNKRSEKNYAAIDIGSNAVRLLIKHINENSEKKFSKVLLLRVPLRLGFDVFSKGRISEKKENIYFITSYSLFFSKKIFHEIFHKFAKIIAFSPAKQSAENGTYPLSGEIYLRCS